MRRANSYERFEGFARSTRRRNAYPRRSNVGGFERFANAIRRRRRWREREDYVSGRQRRRLEHGARLLSFRSASGGSALASFRRPRLSRRDGYVGVTLEKQTFTGGAAQTERPRAQRLESAEKVSETIKEGKEERPEKTTPPIDFGRRRGKIIRSLGFGRPAEKTVPDARARPPISVAASERKR